MVKSFPAVHSEKWKNVGITFSTNLKKTGKVFPPAIYNEIRLRMQVHLSLKAIASCEYQIWKEKENYPRYLLVWLDNIEPDHINIPSKLQDPSPRDAALCDHPFLQKTNMLLSFVASGSCYVT